MTRLTRNLIWLLAGTMLGIMLFLVFANPAFAHGWNHGDITINNYYENPEPPAPPPPDITNVSNTTITMGIDHSDLLALSSAVLAGGAHQFDYSTTKWQLSLTGDFHTSDWDAENEFSVGLGKRFGKDSWLPNALFHGSYTPVLDDDHITLGVTIVLF